MSQFYSDAKQGLAEAIEIEKGNIALREIENMPAPTYVATENVADSNFAIKQAKN